MSQTAVTPVKKKEVKKGGIQYKPELNLTLPDAPSVPCSRFEDYTMLLYGERKIGKTDLIAELDDYFFLMFEPGGRSQELRQRFVPSWKHFLGYIALLEKNPDYCKGVCIDTGFMCYERCFEYCLETMGILKPQDKSWGTAWKFIDKEFREAHTRLFNLGLGFSVTAHSELREVTEKNGAKYDKLSTQLGGQAFRFYGAIVDIIAYYHYAPGTRTRYLQIRRDDTETEAGCRVKKHFFYKGTSEPIVKIPMQGTGAEPQKMAHANLMKAFNNELEKGGANGGSSVAPKPAPKKVIAKKKPARV